jgi:hypothetical protein
MCAFAVEPVMHALHPVTRNRNYINRSCSQL